MGKKTKARRRGGKSKAPDVGVETVVPTTGPAVTIQRIRHADATTRHAALSACLHTQFSVNNLSKKTVAVPLLTSIREQIMNDGDQECAALAAACLSNYVQYCPTQDQALTAGWMVLLTGRLQQCLEQITVATSLTSTADSKKRTKYLILTQQCLQCTVSLLENNPVALNRLLPSQTLQTSPALRDDSLAVWLRLLQLSPEREASAEPSPCPDPTFQTDDLIPSVRLLAVRCLHSAWDDNAELLLSWMREQPLAAQDCLQTLLQTATTATTVNSITFASSMSVTRQTALHGAGAWLAAWELVLAFQDEIATDTRQWAVPWMQSNLVSVVAVLRQAVGHWNTAAVAAAPNHGLEHVLARVRAAHTAHAEQSADANLERQIQTEIDQRKEPARLIARRLKQQKQDEGEAMVDDDDDDDDVLNSDDADETNDNDNEINNGNGESTATAATASPIKRGQLPEDRLDRTQVWEQVQADWLDMVRPVQLALEISVNLTSATGATGATAAAPIAAADQDAGMTEEDQVMDDDDEVEATLDENLTLALTQTMLPDEILQLLIQVTLPDWTAQGPLPAVNAETLADLQNKAGTCLGHCLAALPTWECSPSLWSDLKSAMSNAVGDGRPGISSAMVVALQSRESVRTQLQAQDLNFVLQLLKSDKSLVMRDAVCMLGILCSQEEHPAPVNERACRALLLALTVEKQSVMIMAEVLNALMDIYGDDEVHPAVFDALDVLGHFVRCVPLLKQRISVDSIDADPYDTEQWKETVLNAASFIKYRKDQF
jgi:hypothetical protein